MSMWQRLALACLAVALWAMDPSHQEPQGGGPAQLMQCPGCKKMLSERTCSRHATYGCGDGRRRDEGPSQGPSQRPRLSAADDLSGQGDCPFDDMDPEYDEEGAACSADEQEGSGCGGGDAADPLRAAIEAALQQLHDAGRLDMDELPPGAADRVAQACVREGAASEWVRAAGARQRRRRAGARGPAVICHVHRPALLRPAAAPPI